MNPHQIFILEPLVAGTPFVPRSSIIPGSPGELSLGPTVSLVFPVSLGLDSVFSHFEERELHLNTGDGDGKQATGASASAPSYHSASLQWSASRCVLLKELAKMGDPDLLEEEEGRTAGWL